MTVRLISDMISSVTLNGRRCYRLLLPEESDEGTGPLPLLILLHGVHGSEIDWTEKGNIEYAHRHLLANKKIKPMAILMPSDGLNAIGTGYLNWHQGKPHAYEDYLLKDLLPYIEQKWNVGGSREYRAVAGLSMGGYAAIRLAFSHPGRFASAGSLSGFFDVRELGELIGNEDYQLIFSGDSARMDSVSPLFMDIPPNERYPALMFDCGLEDKYLDMNRQLSHRLTRIGIAHRYREYTGGHDWYYWTENIHAQLLFHSQNMK